MFYSIKLMIVGCALAALLHADINSNSGNINFNLSSDDTQEMKLTSTGLGIGTSVPSANLHVTGNAIFNSNLFIGCTGGNSTVQLEGSLGYSVESISSNATLSSNNSLIMVGSSSTNITLTLPYAGNVNGRKYLIKKTTNSNYVFIKSGGNYYIDNYGEILELSSTDQGFPYVGLVSGANQWYCLSQSSNGVGTIGASGGLSANLIGWWRFDESNGTQAVDSSGSSSGNNGTLMNGFNFTSNKTGGPLGTALSFDGSSDYVHVGDLNNKLDGVRALSISLWVYINAGPADYANLVSKTVDANNRFVFALGGSFDSGDSDDFYFGVCDGSNPYGVTTGSFAVTGTWLHVVAVYDGTQGANAGRAKIFINGLQKTLTFSGTIPAVTDVNNSPFLIGKDYNNAARDWDGYMDDVRIYNRPLTEDEIWAMYNNGAP